ncbi:MAG: hypothetical protein ABS873_02010 [Alkalibacterium sp.]
MKRFFTYAGKSAALLLAFIIAAIAVFLMGVVISLLLNEQKQPEEGTVQEEELAEYVLAYNILDHQRGVVEWSDPESGESGKVLYVGEGTSLQFFDRSGDTIHGKHHVTNEITEIISKKGYKE